MAHRLHAAGIPTELSEHFVNYHVIPKPQRRISTSVDYTSLCYLRPKFVCLKQSALDSSCVCQDHHFMRCHPCPPVDEVCCVKNTCPKLCCQPKSCLSKACCFMKETNCPRSNDCGCSLSANDCNGDTTRVINIRFPMECDDRALEKEMRRKMDKLKKDIQKFDEALFCLENKNPPCESQSLNISYCCKKPKPCVPKPVKTYFCCKKLDPCVSEPSNYYCCKKLDPCELCYAPVMCKQKPHCPPNSCRKIVCPRICCGFK